MNLNSFEASFPLIILARGRAYFENGNVIDLEKVSSYQYEAEVAGSYTYDVTVKLDNNQNIVKLTCDCPYDAGLYCKHQAAVLFALREYLEDEIEESEEGTTSESIDLETLRDFLEAQPKATLVEFLYNLALSKPEIKLMAMATFFPVQKEVPLEHSLLTRAFTLLQTSSSYELDEHFSMLISIIEKTISKAQFLLNENMLIEALKLLLLLLRENMEGFLVLEDYNYIAHPIMTEIMENIQNIISNESAEHSQIFLELFNEAQLSCYEGWHTWRYALLECCAQVVGTTEQHQMLEHYLEGLVTETKKISSPYESLPIQEPLLALVKLKSRYENPTAYREFLLQYREYPEIRRIAIENAVEDGYYEEVERLALEAESTVPEWHRGKREWQMYRCKGYALSGKLDKHRALLREMLLRYCDIQYYHELKATYSAPDWESELQTLLAELQQRVLKASGFWSREALFATILSCEGLKERLIALLQSFPSAIVRYYQELLPEYEPEVYSLFAQYIYNAAEKANKRSEYQKVCEIIRQLQKAGGEREADEIIKELQLLYRSRSAFRDELKRISLFN